MSDEITARIAKLLSKAENTTNEHEADAYMAKVQELVTTHQIELEHVRQAAQRLNRPAAVPTTRAIKLGARGTRGLKTYVALFQAIGHPNGLRMDIAMDSTRIFPYGFAEDIDLTEAMYNSLLVQMVQASEAYLATGEYLNESVWIEGHWRKSRKGENDWSGYAADRVWEDGAHRTPSRVTARIAFRTAFALRVGRRLEVAKARTVSNLEETAPTTGAVVALVEREAAVERFHKDKSDARGSYWSSGRSVKHVAGAAGAGDQAARTARLGTEKAIGGHRTELAG